MEIHAGCGQCKRCREGMYTACHNYGKNYGDVDKGHRANGFTTDGGFCEYQVNSVNTLIAVDDSMSDEEATLVVTAGTSMYGLTELGGLVAGDSVVVSGPGPIGLLGAAVAKALGAHPVILTGTRDNRLEIGKQLGADHVINVRNEDAVEAVRKLTGGKGVDFVLECSGAPNAVNEAAQMLNRGGKICLAAFPSGEASDRRRLPGAQQHLRLRHPRRGQVGDAPRRGVHAPEAVRRDDHPHAHLRHGGPPRGDPLRAGPGGGRDQGRGHEQEADRRAQRGGPCRGDRLSRLDAPTRGGERDVSSLGRFREDRSGRSWVTAGTASLWPRSWRCLVISPFEYSWSSISGHIGDNYGWSDHQIDLMFTLFVVFQSVGMLPGGMLRDKFGPRWTTAIAGLFSALGIFSVTLGPNYRPRAHAVVHRQLLHGLHLQQRASRPATSGSATAEA